MDTFRLAVEDSNGATKNFWAKSAMVYINGTRLYDLAKAAASEPDNDWIAPPPQVLLPPSRQLLGGPDQWEDANEPWFSDGRVAVGACGCSFPGCDALLVEIELTDDEVIWHDFHRHNRPSVTYEGLGPFNFDRREYEAALGAAATDEA